MNGPTFDLTPFLVEMGNVKAEDPKKEPTFEDVAAKQAEAIILFSKLSTKCPYRSMAKIGRRMQEVYICNHEDFDITESPSCLCRMAVCPQL